MKVRYYRGVKVVYLPKWFGAGFSPFNQIWVSVDCDMETIRHEYGHLLQKQKYGKKEYRKKVLLPSLKSYWRYRLKKDMTMEQYLQQEWEAEADKLGGNRWWDGEQWCEPIK